VGEAGSGGGSAPDGGQQHLRDVHDLDALGAEPAACWDVRASDSITRQNGQATAIWSAPVATASSVRLPLILVPSFSSIHIRAPPAPQQNERSKSARTSSPSSPPSAEPSTAPASPSSPPASSNGITDEGAESLDVQKMERLFLSLA